ncbi:MAG: DinB family protein [Phycisphaerales bacterium]
MNLLKHWDESLTGGLWFASWRAALADLTPAQATWKPAPERHSIWQILNHVTYWREVTARKARGDAVPTDDAELARENFRAPETVTATAWKQDVDRFEAVHAAIRALIADPAASHDRAEYHLTHDAHHLGQIMLLRAMQGMKPIE